MSHFYLAFPAQPRGSHIHLWLIWSPPHHTTHWLSWEPTEAHGTIPIKQRVSPNLSSLLWKCNFLFVLSGLVTFPLFLVRNALGFYTCLWVQTVLTILTSSVSLAGASCPQLITARNHTVLAVSHRRISRGRQTPKCQTISNKLSISRKQFALSQCAQQMALNLHFSHSYPGLASVCHHWLANNVSSVSSHSLIRLVWWQNVSRC